MPSAALTSSTFVIPSVFTWSTTQERDLEAQLPMPPAALTHSPRTRAADTERSTNAIDDFFGASSSRGTQDSRHDTVSLPVHHDNSDAPPPYSCSAEPPAYTRYAEHPTLAMYLFKFGFREYPARTCILVRLLTRDFSVFPLFWVAGALILLSPLRAPEEWALSKTEAEREELIASIRQTEIKWARRCLVALSVLILIVLAVVLAVIFTRRA